MAGFILISWPFIALGIFAALGPARGLIWSVAIGYLFLPERYGFDLPALPPYDKYTAISLSALLGVVMFRGREPRDRDMVTRDHAFPKIMIFLLLLVVFSPVGTWLTNTEALVNGALVRQGLTVRDFISMVTESVIMVIPLVLAWRVLYKPEHHRELLIAMVALGLIYSLLVLFEWRMSPRLNIWIYGYFQHDWLQHVRGGGFRSIVFLQHGLAVGFFLLTSVLAAIALSRKGGELRGITLITGLWLLCVLFMSRNFGSSLLAIAFIPIVLMSPLKLQVRIASIAAVIFLTYPVLKQSGLSPDTWVNGFVEKVSPQRAQSFGWRISNETLLLDRALEKPLFGWGGWARMRVFNEWGRDISTVDGIWVVVLGQRGWLGFIAQFGLIVAPVWFVLRAQKRKPITPYIAGMLVITTVNLIDMIPNSTLSPMAFLLLGAVAAFVQFDAKASTVQPEEASERADRQTRYSRFTPDDKRTSRAYQRQI